MRGLTPNHLVNDSVQVSLFHAEAPASVKNAMAGSAAASGFSLDDLVAMIAMLQQLMRHSADADIMLKAAYTARKLRDDVPLNGFQSNAMLIGFFIRWHVGNKNAHVVDLLENGGLSVPDMFEDWDEQMHYVTGKAREYEYKKAHDQKSNPRWNPMKRQFSFMDNFAITTEIILHYSDFWRTECARLKDLVATMDYGSTGRVLLKDFHLAALNGEWRFSESKEYLKEIGALEESDAGPRILVANYIEGPGNCMVATEHYRVCCPSDCEEHLQEIESAVAFPFASVDLLLSIVNNMTSGMDDEKPDVSPFLRMQLSQIAHVHGGKVPIHGRLFAQWLHYLFPRDCPFPHKSGVASDKYLNEYGSDSMASKEELSKVRPAHRTDMTDGKNLSAGSENVTAFADWMSEWSDDEELIAPKFHAPWEEFQPHRLVVVIVLVAALLAVGWLGRQDKLMGSNLHGQATKSLHHATNTFHV